ncbi:protein kinase domain-containing protein [Levilactobacillus zymae]|uniref:protein kinase domain-containing protein n=1 Tax=Levilactobacillus zymae TaxID=267363 RepID=UPI003FCE5F45
MKGTVVVNISAFLNHQVSEVETLLADETGSFPEYELYSKETDDRLRYIFSGLHHEMDALFSFMNDRAQGNKYFNAQPSRDVLQIINICKECEKFLKGTEYEFCLNTDYVRHLKQCEIFLESTEGSTIPDDYQPIIINQYDVIFHLKSGLQIKNGSSVRNEQLKLLGEGSYVRVFKFKDTYYNKYFALKRLKKESRSDEIERFKREFSILKQLNSPYILKAYKYNEPDNEYIMDYANGGTLLYFLGKLQV